MYKKQLKRTRHRKIFVISTLIICCLIMVYTFSKYAIQLSSEHIQSAKKFYFESEILKVNDIEYVLDDWNGIDEYILDIPLKNYEDVLRYTNEDIIYNLNATSENTNIQISQSVQNGQIIGGNVKDENITIKITPKSTIPEGESVQVRVTAQTVSPYEKTLTANFKISASKVQQNEFSIVDSENSNYANLYISTKNAESTITITYNNTKAVIDTTNDLLKDANINTEGIKNSITLTLKSNSNYSIGFIKKDITQVLQLGTDIIIKQ